MEELELMQIAIGCMMARRGLDEVVIHREEAEKLLKGMGVLTHIENQMITVKFLPSEEVERLEKEMRNADANPQR